MKRFELLAHGIAAGSMLLFGACFPDYQVGASAAGNDGGTESSASSGGGAFQLTGSTQAYSGYPSPTTVTFTYTVKQAGDLVIVGTYIASAGGHVSSVTGSLGEGYSPAGTQSGGTVGAECSGLSANVQLFYANAVAAGSDTISLTEGGTDGFGAFLLEYTGAGGAAKLDGTASAAGSTATMAMTAGGLTTTGAADLVVALFADKAQTGTMTAGDGFTAQGLDTGFAAMIEDDLPAGATPGVRTAGATEAPPTSDAAPDGDECWAAVSAAFR